ncbi:MAG: O-antigen ligase family protein [Clostridia bacterium]
MKMDKLRKIFGNILGIFIIIQPILDIYFLYTDEIINIFKFSPSTLIRFGIIGLGFIYLLVEYRKDRKILPLIIYVVISVVYAILHHLFVRNFDSLDPDNFGYSMFSELFYIARLILPIIMTALVVDFDMTIEKLIKYFSIVACIVGSMIVFLNLFKIALGSYTNEFIKDNIFGWFNGAYEKYSFYELASKGWFNFANQISAILAVLFIMVIYSLSKKISVFNCYNFVVILLAMLMIGTKVALYSPFLVILAYVAIYVICYFFQKKRKFINKWSLLLIIILMGGYVGLIKYSPATNRAQINNYIIANREDDEENEDGEKEFELLKAQLTEVKTIGTEEEKIEFIKENYEKFSINKEFIEDSYSYEIDPDFWLNEFEKPLEYRLNYRKLEQEMIQRVVDINDKDSSVFFGISYIRVQNIFNIERDFILQYYTIGLIGLMLFIILPFVVPTIICGIFILRKHKEYLTEENMVMILSVLMILGIAFYSGNVIDSLIITIYLSSILGVLLKETVLSKKMLEEKNKK